MEQGKSKSLRFSNKENKLIPRDISESLGKLPPQALDLEEAVLGALMLERNAILELADHLKADHFYDDRHKEIYAAMLSLFHKSDPIDMRTVVNELRSTGKIEIIGGAYYIAELTSKVSSAANIDYHARIIQEHAIKRNLIEMASEIHHNAYEDTTDVFELLADIHKMIEEIHDGNLTGKAEKHVKEIAMDNIRQLDAIRAGGATGVNWDLKEVDKITHGSQNSDLIILAARPGMGKTALVGQVLKNVAQRGEPVAMFSLEMPGGQVVNRIAISECEIDAEKVRTGKLSDTEYGMFITTQAQISNLPIYIDDSAMLNIIEIMARSIRMKKKYGIKMIVVDYIQLINGKTGNSVMNRDQEIGVITRMLKAIAKKLDIPVIAISSLSRGVETRGGDKRPQLSDLRESGNIESDADVVMFLYRPEYYKIEQDEDGIPTHGKAEVIFAKHRNGALGTAVIRFLGRFTKFTDWYVETASIDWSQRSKDPSESIVENQRLITMEEAQRRIREQQAPPADDDTPF